MKKSLFICGLIVFKLAGAAQAAIVINNDWTVNTAIPDGSPRHTSCVETQVVGTAYEG